MPLSRKSWATYNNTTIKNVTGITQMLVLFSHPHYWGACSKLRNQETTERNDGMIEWVSLQSHMQWFRHSLILFRGFLIPWFTDSHSCAVMNGWSISPENRFAMRGIALPKVNTSCFAIFCTQQQVDYPVCWAHCTCSASAKDASQASACRDN